MLSRNVKTELEKLKEYLDEHNYRSEYKHIWPRCDEHGYTTEYKHIGVNALVHGYPNQIIVYDENKNRLWDVVYHTGSYGGYQGKLEAMGLGTDDPDDVIGWLTAEDVIKILEEKNG